MANDMYTSGKPLKMVFDLLKSVHRIKSYDQKKNKKIEAFLANPTFLTENL
jgi:hypothetical protein